MSGKVTSNDLDLPSQSIISDISNNFHNCAVEIPKLFNCQHPSPTIVQYDKSIVFDFPNDGQGFASEIPSVDDLSPRHSSILYTPGLQSNVTKPKRVFQSNFIGSRLNFDTGFHSNFLDLTNLSSYIPDCQLNLTTLQPNVERSWSSQSFHESGVDPRSTTVSFSKEANMRSQRIQDIYNYYPRHRTVTSFMESDMNVANARKDFESSTQSNIYYRLPNFSTSPSQRSAEFHEHVPTEQCKGGKSGNIREVLHHESEYGRSIGLSYCSPMVPNQGRGRFLSENMSDLWPGFLTDTDTGDNSGASLRLSVSSENMEEWNKNVTSIGKEKSIDTITGQVQRSSCRFSVPSQINMVSTSSNAKCEVDSSDKYFQEILSTCARSERPMIQHNGLLFCEQTPFIPALQQPGVYTYNTNSTQALPPTFTAQPQSQLPHTTPPIYRMQPEDQLQTCYTVTPSYSKTYDSPCTPRITKVESFGEKEKSFNSSLEYRRLNLRNPQENLGRAWFSQNDSEYSITQTCLVPDDPSDTFQPLSRNSDDSKKHIAEGSPQSSLSSVCLSSQSCSDLVKFPLTREERKRKILAAFGFKTLDADMSSSFCCKFRKADDETDTSLNTYENKFKSVQISSSFNVDQRDVLSRGVVEASSDLGKSCLKRWKTVNNINSSTNRSSTQFSKEKKCPTHSKKTLDTRQPNEEELLREETGVETSVPFCQKNTNQSSQEEKRETKHTPPFPHRYKVGITNVSNTKKTVAIQVESEGTKPLRLRRPHYSMHKTSTATQTDHLISNDTMLPGKNKEGKKMGMVYKPNSSVAGSKNVGGKDFVKHLTSRVEGNVAEHLSIDRMVEEKTSFDNCHHMEQSSLVTSGETGHKKRSLSLDVGVSVLLSDCLSRGSCKMENCLPSRIEDVSTTSSKCLNNSQPILENIDASMSSKESPITNQKFFQKPKDAAISFARFRNQRRSKGKKSDISTKDIPYDISLHCDEVVNGEDTLMFQEEGAVYLQTTNKQVELTFVDETTISMSSDAKPPWVFTCLKKK